MPYPLSGYSVGGATEGISSGASQTETNETGTEKKQTYWSLQRCRRAYLDYLGTKREEINEQQDARRIMHGSQWTSEQIKQLNLRRQPVTTNNQISRKIHGVVGTLERLRQDPKAYPRTPKHEQGAELATGALRYALDSQEWSTKDALCSEMCAIDGIGGLEFNLTEGDHGDREIELDVVQTDSFFYDPRSYRSDFDDARYMGVGKWLDLDSAIDLYPEYEEDLRDSIESGDDLSSQPDREFKWFHSYGEIRRVRIVDIWYKMRGEWCYTVFTGNTKLMEGLSYFKDEKNKTACKYEMFSGFIDQDGDRYGLIRNLKPLQQQINMRESKALYTMLSRRLKAEKGAFDDVEVARREGARPDGVIIFNKGFEAEFDNAARMAETEAQFKFLENVKKDFDSFGPNISLLGQGLENASGRAIHLLQQAGLADLGPFIQSYRGWKIRVYRKMWGAIQQHWQGERWIRVTDDDDLTQFIQVNGVQVDPMTGMPTMVNYLGSLDVDIILDEGPDEVNQMADAYDALTALVQGGTQIPPQVLIELAPIPLSVKKKVQEQMNPSDPESQQKKQMVEQLQMQDAQAKIAEAMANAKLKEAQATKALADASRPPDQQAPGEDPRKIEMELAKTAADMEKTRAETEKTRIEAGKTQLEMQLAPQKMAMEQQAKASNPSEDEMNFEQTVALRRLELQHEAQQKQADREHEFSMMDPEAPVRRRKVQEDVGKQVTQITTILKDGLETTNKKIDQIGAGLQQVNSKVDELAQDMNAPSTVERDANGKAKGIRKGKRYIQVQRGADGRMTGAQ